MNTNWELLAGDTGRFALKVGLGPDPFEGRGVSEEMSSSWGAFELWVDGRNICAQTEGGETLTAVHWYLLPLFEWLVENWDPLIHEERLPIEVAGATAARSLRDTAYAAVDPPPTGAAGWQAWWSRHSLSAARAGGLFPEVILRRWRDQVEISWDSLFIPGAPRTLAFAVPQGSARLPPAEVAQPLATVLQAVVAELQARCPASARVAQLQTALADLERQGRSEQRTAWLAGLGATFDEMLERWRRVVQRLSNGAEQLTRPHAEPLYVAGTPKAGLMFGAVAPNIGERDVESLTAFLLALYTPHQASSGADADAWVDLVGGIDPRSAPWRQGYDLAEAFLDELAVDRTSVVDVDALLQRLDVAVTQTALDDRSIRGLAAAGPEHRPAIAINPNYPFHDRDEVQRFTKGHELCHLLFDRTAARELAQASGPWAAVEIEQRANAFAAMLLMPEPLVRTEFGALADGVASVSQLMEISERLGVSIRALAWHAANLGLVPRAVAQQAAVSVRPGSETVDSAPA